MTFPSEPETAEAYNKHANMLKESGQLDEAVDCCMKALAIKPDYAEAYGDLGLIYKEQGKLDKAIASYRQALILDPDYAKVYVNLGVVLHEGGLLNEAAANYKRALALKSDYVAAHFNLGALQMSLGQTTDALASFRKALIFQPDLSQAAHMIAVLEGNTTQSAPHDFVQDLFNRYAQNFEHHLVNKLKYTAPWVIFQKFNSLLANEGRRLNQAIDLGCGTGINGELFRGIVDRLEGVDLADKMLEIASQKNVYDSLHLADIITFLNESNEFYDLFLATDVFIYVGALETLFEAIKNHSLPGAYFAFCTEWLEGTGFALQNSARYAHSREYIHALCDRFGFEIALCEGIDLRKDQDEWIRGDIYILQLATN